MERSFLFGVKWFNPDTVCRVIAVVLIQICRVVLGYQVKWFDPDMKVYCGGIRLNGLIQI